MSVNKKQILDTLLEIIWTISDKDYQRRIWIVGVGPECDSFDEAINEFSSIGNAIIEEYKDFEIAKEQLNILIKFRDIVSAFPRKYDLPQEFINTLEWKKIMEMAREVLKAFNYKRQA
jgi:hypothetical protein